MRARNEPPHPLPKKRVHGLSGGNDSVFGGKMLSGDAVLVLVLGRQRR